MRRTRIVGFALLALLCGMASLAAQSLLYTAKMIGGNEIPPTGSAAWGVAFVILNPLDGTVSYRVSSGGFGDAPNAVVSGHIHPGGPKVNGGVKYPLSVDATGNGSGSFQLTPPDVAAFVKTEFYVNLHTQANPGGVIRGQLTLNPGPDYLYVASMNSANENPATNAPGKGTALLYAELNSSKPRLAYGIASTGFGDAPNAVISSHIHPGNARTNGGVLVPLPVDASGNGGGVASLTETQKNGLLRNEVYVNLHTAQYPSGAIRGQAIFYPGPSVEYVFNRNVITGSREFSIDSGPSVTDGEAISKGQLIDLLDLGLMAGLPQAQVTPAFDPTQFPSGAPRVRVVTQPVTIRAGTRFMVAPGLALSAAALPDGISRSDFRDLFYQDYAVSINDLDVNQMAGAPFLCGPVVVGGAQLGMPPAVPSITITGYNITFRIDTPGEYLVGVRWKTGKTLKEVDVDGSNLEAMEFNVTIPVSVSGHRPSLPLGQNEEFEIPSSSSWSHAQQLLSQAIRQALDEYFSGTDAEKTHGRDIRP